MADLPTGIARIRRLVQQLDAARTLRPLRLLVTDEEHEAIFYEMLDLASPAQTGLGGELKLTKRDLYDMHSGDVRVLGVRLMRPREWEPEVYHG